MKYLIYLEKAIIICTNLFRFIIFYLRLRHHSVRIRNTSSRTVKDTWSFSPQMKNKTSIALLNYSVVNLSSSFSVNNKYSSPTIYSYKRSSVVKLLINMSTSNVTSRLLHFSWSWHFSQNRIFYPVLTFSIWTAL